MKAHMIWRIAAITLMFAAAVIEYQSLDSMYSIALSAVAGVALAIGVYVDKREAAPGWHGGTVSAAVAMWLMVALALFMAFTAPGFVHVALFTTPALTVTAVRVTLQTVRILRGIRAEKTTRASHFAPKP